MPAPKFKKHASRGMWAAGGAFFLASLIDLGVLWLGQRLDNVNWEFVAIANTLEALPQLVLAVALFYVALYLDDSQSLAAHRALATVLIIIGLTAAGLGALMTMDYFILSSAVNEEAAPFLKSTVFKALSLATIYVVVLIPIGALSMRKPKS